MTLEIAGETTGLGVGPVVVVSKDATTCEATCGAGPSCNACQEQNGSDCLTRTIGFWGTHPWITNDFDPVTVCGKSLSCNGEDDGKSNHSCPAGFCDSVMEGLGSIGGEDPKNSSYISMIKQLTAAKLNLNATADKAPGATCSSWTYQGMTIQQWIAYCDNTSSSPGQSNMCNQGKATISNSGCIEALNAFNNSDDTGKFADQTYLPFDRPSLDDYGNVSGADPSQFNKAQGNGGDPKLVIGKYVGGKDCR